MKDLGSCDLYPQSLQHNPNGRFVTVCGDGEYIIYTALAWRNKSFGSALEFVWGNESNDFAIRCGKPFSSSSSFLFLEGRKPTRYTKCNDNKLKEHVTPTMNCTAQANSTPSVGVESASNQGIAVTTLGLVMAYCSRDG